ACPETGLGDVDRVGVAHVADADGSPRTVDDREVARVALRTLRAGSARGARRARSTGAAGSARSTRAAGRTVRAVRAVGSCRSLGAGELRGTDRRFLLLARVAHDHDAGLLDAHGPLHPPPRASDAGCHAREAT